MKLSNRSIVLFCLLVTLVGLALMSYMGFYNRYWQDDWCYNRDINNLGLWKTINTYFLTGEEAHRGYSTNRYGLTLLYGLFFLPGLFGTQIIATLLISLWLASLAWTFSNLSRLTRPLPIEIILLGSAVLLYFNLFFSPQRFQVLYWQAGVHYSFSMLTAITIFGMITSQMVRQQESKFIRYLTVPLALFGGGLSEIGNVYLLAVIILILSALWHLKRRQERMVERALPTVWTAFGFLVLAMIILIVSPSNSRYADMAVKPTSLLLVPFLSFRYALDFMVDSIKSLPLPHFVLAISFVCLSIVSSFMTQRNLLIKLWKTSLIAGLIFIAVWLLISAVQAPGVRFYSAPPDPRGQSLSRFTMLTGFVVIAWLYGQYLSTFMQRKWLNLLAVVGLLISSAYVVRMIRANYLELPEFIHRAQLWDRRDASIKQSKEQELEVVEVLVIDMKGLGVQDIMRSKDMEKEFVVTCGSEYYGVNAIKAVSP